MCENVYILYVYMYERKEGIERKGYELGNTYNIWSGYLWVAKLWTTFTFLLYILTYYLEIYNKNSRQAIAFFKSTKIKKWKTTCFFKKEKTKSLLTMIRIAHLLKNMSH